MAKIPVCMMSVSGYRFMFNTVLVSHMKQNNWKRAESTCEDVCNILFMSVTLYLRSNPWHSARDHDVIGSKKRESSIIAGALFM